MTFENVINMKSEINKRTFCKLTISIRISYHVPTIQFLLFKLEGLPFSNIWGAGM